MTYDPYGQTPRSVQYQRRLERFWNRFKRLVTFSRLLGVTALAVLIDLHRKGEFTSTGTSTSTTDLLATYTLEDIAVIGAIMLGFGVILVINTAVHELCHWAAFRYYGVEAYWTVHMPEIRGQPLPIFANGGLCWPRHSMAMQKFTYTESAVVYLAPLAWASIVFIALSTAFLLGGVPWSPFWLGIAVLGFAGPSPPDWFSLAKTPKARWDRLVDLTQAQREHRAAEGYRVRDVPEVRS